MPEFKQNKRRKPVAEQKKREPLKPEREKRRDEEPPRPPVKKAPIQREMPPRSPDAQRKPRPQQAAASVRKKRKYKKNFIVYYVLLSLLAVAVISILSVTVLFNVDTIVIEGESVYTDDEIISKGMLTTDVNLIRLDTATAQKLILDGMVYLDAVDVRRSFPSTITVAVTAAQPVANVLTQGKYYILSGKGRVLEERETPLPDLPVIIGCRVITTTVGEYVRGDKAVQPVIKAVTEADDSKERRDAAKALAAYEQSELDEKNARTQLLYTLLDAFERNEFSGVTKIDMTDRLYIKLTYGTLIEMELGTSAELDDKLIVAKELIANEIGENEHVTLVLTNPLRAVKRPIYDTVVTTAPEAEPEETQTDESDGADTTSPPPDDALSE